MSEDELAIAARRARIAAEETEIITVSRYEVYPGIRPPRKSGKIRGVAAEVVPGGGLELWSCEHDHAPGVRRVQDLTPQQAAEAMGCAESYLAGRMDNGTLHRMRVVRAWEA